MLVKNLRVVLENINGENKLLIVKENNFFEDSILRRNPREFKCAFTGNIYYFDPRDPVSLSSFLSPEDMNKTISRKKLKKFYIENEENIIKKLVPKRKTIIGFK
ncbi:MAG: hypothetical protein ACI4OG_01040 [Bacilli bacterium]